MLCYNKVNDLKYKFRNSEIQKFGKKMANGETWNQAENQKSFWIFRRGEKRMDDFKKLTEQLMKISV